MNSVSTAPAYIATQAAQARHPVWKTSILYTAVATLLFGTGYPLVVTLLAGALFPHKAAGSLILKDGQVIGSELLGQSFTSDKYFQ